MSRPSTRPVLLNIHVHSHEEIAAHILSRAKKWRCPRMVVIVAGNGDIRCRDLAHDSGRNDPRACDIIGTFGYGSQVEDIEDAVLSQMREMRVWRPAA
ncbi:hypothetical protein [Pseudoxanthomonas sp. USHLN014]|uniref:hypothetical protein n=1 Tax=Pseudoxanthomonas sp. USHLN014 TaxID=3081297 RepID=UPI00301D423F